MNVKTDGQIPKTEPPKDPKLPVSLVLWCQREGKARWFGLRYGSTYDCPCGEFLWDVFKQEEEE